MGGVPNEPGVCSGSATGTGAADIKSTPSISSDEPVAAAAAEVLTRLKREGKEEEGAGKEGDEEEPPKETFTSENADANLLLVPEARKSRGDDILKLSKSCEDFERWIGGRV